MAIEDSMGQHYFSSGEFLPKNKRSFNTGSNEHDFFSGERSPAFCN